MTRYTISCHSCKRRQVFEYTTVGECFKAADEAGWKWTGEGTQRVCKGCDKNVAAPQT